MRTPSRFQFVDDHRGAFGVKRQCRILAVSRSGFYRWLAGADARADRAQADVELAEHIAVLARAQQDATWNHQQISNQLRSLLREYYPAALDAFGAWQNGLCRPEARELLKLAPTPARAARLTRSQIAAALRRGRPQPQA